MTVSQASTQKIPQEWVEAYSRLRELGRPKRLASDVWLRIQYNAIALYKNDTTILKTIIANGWSLLDIFGCHCSASTRRFDCRGLLIAKNQQDRIVGITNDSIKLKKQNGTIQGVYKPLLTLSERILLYELN